MKNYLGIDIGGTSVKIGIVNELGVVLKQTEARVDFDSYTIPILETVVVVIHRFLESNNIDLVGIGVSATGQIDVRNGIVIGTCGNIPNYIDSHIKERMEVEFNLPCFVINDANCMILGEKWIGSCQNHADVVGMTIGTGIGGGILVNNHILLGSKGLAGEIGHFIIQKDGQVCTCGNKGCLEPLAASSYLVKRVKEALNLNYEINGKWIFENAHNGNIEILKIIDEWTDIIADAIISLVHIFNPSCIVLGGGVSAQEKLLINPIRTKVLTRVMPRFSDGLVIVSAQLKNNAGLIGAVYYFIQNYKG